MEYSELIKKMTLEEKASLCVGGSYWKSKGIERLGIPEIVMSDGPHGLRFSKSDPTKLGLNDSETSTCFPSGATLANTWNRNLAYKMGKALGKEARSKGVNILLGPAINIKRSPLCGRNFEYFSEDPYLAGSLASEYINGLQSENVGACVKHFAVNNQENRRMTVNVVIDDRTLREIYLKAFQMIIDKAKPWSIMSAYIRLNGVYCTENEYLLNEILRKEWNFNGIVISDWGAENDRVSGIKVGQEIEMPAGSGDGVNEIINAVKSGEIEEKELDEIVDRILVVAFRGKDNELESFDQEKHHEIAEEIAEEAIVLLKNDDNILPIKNKKIALIGDMAENPRYQGAGSSRIVPYKIENAKDNFEKNGVDFEYSKGYERIENQKKDEKLRIEAVKLAKNSEIVVIFAGLTENYETEGLDRNSLNLPENQTKLIDEVCKVNKNVVVVLSNGSPIEMPWKNKVKAIITGYLGGEASGSAMINCLIGKSNPSGKLAETYPLQLEDTPCFANFPGTEVSCEYRESIYVGYRYYDKKKLNVLFPFGYGLSYTKFKYFKLETEQIGKTIKVSFRIKNIGKVKGKEIAEVYVSQKEPVIFKPEKELKGFEKIELEPGEEKEVVINLDKSSFEYYNVEKKKWSIENGEYFILVGKSSREIELKEKIKLISNDENISKNYADSYKTGNVKNVADKEFEELLGFKIPDRNLKIKDASEYNTVEQLKNTRVGKVIWDEGMRKMHKLMKEQRINEALEVMVLLQKPLKKAILNHNNNITKEMVEEFLNLAKTNGKPDNCKLIDEFWKEL